MFYPPTRDELYAKKGKYRKLNQSMAIPWRNLVQTDMGYDRGNIGKGGIGGGIRMAQIDERTKVRVSQTLKKNLAKQKASWGGASTVKKQVSGINEFLQLLPFSSALLPSTLIFLENCGGKLIVYLDSFPYRNCFLCGLYTFTRAWNRQPPSCWKEGGRSQCQVFLNISILYQSSNTNRAFNGPT